MGDTKHKDLHMVEHTPEIGAATALTLPEGTLDPVYEAKARVLNNAIQEIGMGWYVCGINCHFLCFVHFSISSYST